MLKFLLTFLYVIIGITPCVGQNEIPDQLSVYTHLLGGQDICDGNGKIGSTVWNLQKLELRGNNEIVLAKATSKFANEIRIITVVDGQDQPIGTILIHDKNLIEFFAANGNQLITAPSFYTLWPYHGHWRTVFTFIDIPTNEEVAVFSYHTDANYRTRSWFTVTNRDILNASLIDFRVIALFLAYPAYW